MTVLMNTPDLTKGGGVTTFCRVIRPHFTDNVTYFTIGSRKTAGGILSGVINLFRGYASYWQEIRKKDIRLIHLNPSLGYKAVLRDGLFLVMGKMMGKKVVVFFHGWNDRCEQLIRRYFLFLFRLIYARADATIVLAATFQRRLRDMGFAGTVVTETTTIDAGMIAHAASVVSSRSWPSRDRFTILFLSRIEREKGIYEALEAYSILKQRQPQVTLLVVGDGSELEKVRQHVAKHCIADVELAGFTTGHSLQQCYVRADVYLFPTRHGEGFPISIIEAMAYGLPVLTRPVGGIADFFKDGIMGFLREDAEPGEWAMLLEQLVLNPAKCREMGEHNHRYVTHHLCPGEVVNRLEAIYRKVLTNDQEWNTP